MLKSVRPAVPVQIESLESRLLLSLLNQQLFPADNPWNQKITQALVAANSAAIMASITGTYGNGRLHPDFGQDYRTTSDLYGIPYNIVHGNTAVKVHVVIDDYADESDLRDVAIPANAVVEGDLQNGPKTGRGDSHLLIWDVDNNVAYEFYNASRPSENGDGKWHAAGESVWDLKTNTFRTLGWTSADAAGLPILPGLVRPDEGLPVSEGGQGVINHAIRFTLQNAVILNQFIYPASHIANSGSNASIQPPMGARFRLKASVDISQMSPESRIIAQAMKDYGMIVADNGSNFYLSGASYSVDASNQNVLTWNDNDIQDSVHGLKSLHYGDFEVVDLTPAITGLSANSGAPGTRITITGRNFTGAAGRLKVLLGNTPATGVTILDDSHLTAVVPSGSGVLDIRVQSGISDPNDSQNIKSPIFGYGTSATGAADRFTITSGVNQAPTDVALSATEVAENLPVGTVVGTLSGTDPDPGQSATLSFTLVSGYGDNAAFTIDPATRQLKTNAIFSYASKSSYTIKVRATDSSTPGLSYDKVFTIGVIDLVEHAPTITGVSDDTAAPGDGITSDRTLIIRGTADPGMTVTLYRGTTRIGTTPADQAGAWTYDDTSTPLADGPYALTATASDTMNRVSPVSAVYNVTVDGTALTVAAFMINGGGAQRSMVNSITLTFSEPVVADLGAIVLQSSTGSAIPNVILGISNPTGDGKTYLLTFSGPAVIGGSLPDGLYRVRVRGYGIHDGAGNLMAAPYTASFHRLFGDADGDRNLDSADRAGLNLTLNNPAAYRWFWDYNQDGKVDDADLLQFRIRRQAANPLG